MWLLIWLVLNVSLVFITQSYFALAKYIRLTCTHYFIVKIPHKQEFKQTASKNSSSIYFQDFMNLYKKCIAKSYSFLVIDSTLASDNPLHFRKNLIERV